MYMLPILLLIKNMLRSQADIQPHTSMLTIPIDHT